MSKQIQEGVNQDKKPKIGEMTKKPFGQIRSKRKNQRLLRRVLVP